ncbi:hypothetical protein BLX87_09825 [Bacillus sp. VT-16-64]|nr:hypothetical protein BLX87_09825 [Bacillus sp. VT-16-64]
MQKIDKLIPIYREQKAYTIFYDREHHKFYKFQHQEFYAILILIIYSLAILGGIYLANEIFLYFSFAGNAVNMFLLTCIGIVIIGSYFVAKMYYRSFYAQKPREIFLNRESMETYARKGIQQYRVAIYAGGGLSVLMALISFILTLVFARLDFLVLGGLGITNTFHLLFIKPFTTQKILKQMVHNEINDS